MRKVVLKPKDAKPVGTIKKVYRKTGESAPDERPQTGEISFGGSSRRPESGEISFGGSNKKGNYYRESLKKAEKPAKMETKPLSSMRVSPSANMQNASLKTAINAAAKKGGLFKKKG